MGEVPLATALMMALPSAMLVTFVVLGVLLVKCLLTKCQKAGWCCP